MSDTAKPLMLNNADTRNAHPFGDIRDLLDWYEGLFAWGIRWRDEARRLRGLLGKERTE